MKRVPAFALACALFCTVVVAGSVAAAPKGPKECPQMTNPGGGLDWKPSEDPGPDPTKMKVELPTLATTAPIVRVGIDKDNKMVVPRNARDVAWLDRGKIPGTTKNVVLAGHINYSGADGSFVRIRELKKGQDIYLNMGGGKKLHFKVTFNCTFPRDTEHAEQIMGRTTVPSVTLVSCGGEFDRSAGTHDKRIVVRAEQYPRAKAEATPKPTSKPDPKKPKPTPTPTPGLLERLLP